jgi:hypothetical protein
MNSYQIHAIATRAMLDASFRSGMLNGQRRQMLQEFDLSKELVDVIMSIEGNDIHQFIFELNKLVTSNNTATTRDQWVAMPIQSHCNHE